MKAMWLKIGLLTIAILFLTVSIARAMNRRKKIGLMSIRNLTGALSKSRWKRYKRRSLEAIEQIVIHHSATDSGSAEAYARYHVNERGWPGIGYHFVIDKDGTINQTNELTTVSYHTSGQNTRSIGICLTGDYDEQTPPALQLEACARLVRNLSMELGRTLSLAGHREYSSKSCPGDNIDIAWIENRAYELV